MTIQIAVDGGAQHDVRLTRSGARATVWVDGMALSTTSACSGGALTLSVDERRETVWYAVVRNGVLVHAFGRAWMLHIRDTAESSLPSGVRADAAIAPMPGVVVSLPVRGGDPVAAGQVLVVIESMKMHSEIASPRAGVVDRVLAKVGDNFDVGTALVTLLADDSGASEDAAS